MPPAIENTALSVSSWRTIRARLPPIAARMASSRERTAMRRRYVASKRHTMQVDYDDYLFALRRERKLGAART